MTALTILGSGFAALTAARERRRNGVTAEITMISPRAALHDLPSVIWMPTHLRKRADLKIPLARFFAEQKVSFVQASVTGLAEGGRVVLTMSSFFSVGRAPCPGVSPWT